MCRSKILGGRRCSAHSDPIKRAAYNAHRRELYAAKKHAASSTKVEASVPVGKKDSSKQKVTLISKNAPRWGMKQEQWDKINEETEEYVNILKLEDSANNITATNEKSLAYAIAEYTGTAHADIANYLNGHDVTRHGGEGIPEAQKFNFDAQEKAELKVLVKNLDKAIALAPQPAEPRTVWRGVVVPTRFKDEKAEWIKRNFPVGGVISQKNYMSTSVDPAIANERFTISDKDDESVIIEIISKQGAPLMHQLSSWEEESEVLMPRKAKFKVARVLTDNSFVTRRGYSEVDKGEYLPIEEVMEKSGMQHGDENTDHDYIPKKKVTIIQLVDVDSEVEVAE